jgi:hypothetical protein
VKIYNSTPPYAVMVHTRPTSLCLLHIQVQFYVLNVAYIVCTLIHWGRSVFTNMGTYLYTAVRISHIHSYVTLLSKAVNEELSGYQTGGPGFILYYMWTGWCSLLTSLSKSSAPSMQATFFDLKWKIHKEFLPSVSSMYCLEVQKCELVRIIRVRQALEHGQLSA